MLKKLIALGAAAAVTLSAWALTAKEQAVVDRIAHTASACVVGDPCAGEAGAVAVVASASARSGDAVYTAGCAACHASGAAGAPMTGNAAAWEPRQAKGIDTLVQHAYNGYNAMPAKGLCADCSEEEIRGAVEYILSQL